MQFYKISRLKSTSVKTKHLCRFMFSAVQICSNPTAGTQLSCKEALKAKDV